MTEHLFLPFPLSVNAMYKNAGKARAKSKRYREWIEGAQWQLAGQHKGKPITGPLMLTLAIKQPDRRRRDLGNLEKCVTDLMTGVVYEDDSQIKILAMHFDETDSPVGTRVMIDRLSAPIAVNFLRTFEKHCKQKAEQTERISKSAQPVPNISTKAKGGQHA